MEANEYQALAMRTSNKTLTNKEHLINGALGLCGESGEVADIIKKHTMQGHPMNRERIAEELSDVYWYLAETATAIGYTLDEIQRMNVEKLLRRYPDKEGFSAERSINREE